LRAVDPTGEWPEDIHNLIIEQACDGLMTEADIGILKTMSALVDEFQDPEDSYLHAMTGPNQTPDEAKTQMWEFVNTATDEYVRTGSARSLGVALHPLMDLTAPSHEGHQVWDVNLWNPLDWPAGIVHLLNERSGDFQKGQRGNIAIEWIRTFVLNAVKRRATYLQQQQSTQGQQEDGARTWKEVDEAVPPNSHRITRTVITYQSSQ
jgi:hypothetical protein